MASQWHILLLIEELNKIDLSPNTMPKKMIASITTGKGTITFNSEDLPPGAQHVIMLYI